jgi:large subunit ribosomal protein L6
MSRIGKKPIVIPEKVEAKIDGDSIIIKGPKGELKQKIHPNVNIAIEDKHIIIKVENPEIKDENALWGLFGSLVRNMIIGVTEGFEKRLEINGIGFKALVSGSKLQLNLGFSHAIDFLLPAGITAAVDKNIVVITGIDKQLVGETAARIRTLKKPEPYKGTGIRFVGEIVRLKAGKAAKAAGAAGSK